jgi:hypothetical protein
MTPSFDGVGFTTTVLRPFPLTMKETTTKTVSVSYPCFGEGLLGRDSISHEQLVGGRQVSMRWGTVDAPEELFHVLGRGGCLQHLNL